VRFSIFRLLTVGDSMFRVSETVCYNLVTVKSKISGEVLGSYVYSNLSFSWISRVWKTSENVGNEDSF
jgi:hypothetical protein